MAAIAVIDDLTPEHAQFLIESVAPVTRAAIDDEHDGPRVRVLMPAAGIDLLSSLSSDDDGFLDEDSQLWIGGDVAGRAGRVGGFRS